VAEGSLEFLGVLAGLAESEFQVHPIVGRGVSSCQLAAHRLDVGGGKAERLQIGEAPPGDRESGDQLETPAVRTDRFVLSTGGLEDVTEAQPYHGLERVFGQQVRVQVDRLPILADI